MRKGIIIIGIMLLMALIVTAIILTEDSLKRSDETIARIDQKIEMAAGR